MNGLSWLLLAADVLGGLNVMLNLMGIFLGAVGVVAVFAWLVTEGDVMWNPASMVRLVLLAAALMLAAALIPGQRTVYLIAASEIGEAADVPGEMRVLYGELKTIIGALASEAGEKAK